MILKLLTKLKKQTKLTVMMCKLIEVIVLINPKILRLKVMISTIQQVIVSMYSINQQ